MAKVDKGLVEQLIEGTISREDARSLLKMDSKDPERFWTYLEALQERVSWDDAILLRIADHLYIVAKENGDRVVKCDCSQEFGDYRANWKLSALIRLRETPEEIQEVYYPAQACPDPEWVVIREFYCPGCAAQLAVEVVPPGYPIVFEMLPDLDRFYRDFVDRPLSDAKPDWYQDQTHAVTANWAKGSA